VSDRDARHCATCRCASTITGRIAKLLDDDSARQLTCEEIAEAIGYAGERIYLRTTLDRMAREEKILRTGKRYGTLPENVADLRVFAKRRTI
jgi:hypothetical protein